jgi:aryl-alcohol dehydrogenase-like predicted oxidoreductase
VIKVSEIAKRKGVKPGQLALAWVLAQGKDIVPIPGTTIPEHLKENIEALNIKLSDEDLDEINQVMPEGAASGLRYPESMMHLVNG